MNFQPRLIGIVIGLLGAALGTGIVKGDSPGGNSTIYDPNPRHLWNRLNDALFIRTGPDGLRYGYDELDPLIWQRSRDLLQGDSRKQALAALDEFLLGHGEKLVRDPLGRAWLQHDLWLLFDWAASESSNAPLAERRELELRVSAALRRLELTPREIAALPDNYEQSGTNTALQDFVGGLFKPGSGWVCLQAAGSDMIAPSHGQSFGGRSVFLVMARFPGGAAEAESYLARFAAFQPRWVDVTNVVRYYTGSNTPGIEATNVTSVLNTNLPQFPANTRWALVRRMCVIDSSGEIQPTLVTESIQTRRYLAIKNAVLNGAEALPQQMADFIMDRRNAGRLRTLGAGERDFTAVHFFSNGVDPFEPVGKPATLADFQNYRTRVLLDCFTCHLGAGLYSVQSLTGAFSPARNPLSAVTPSGSPEHEAWATSLWKNHQFDWGLLQGLRLRPD